MEALHTGAATHLTREPRGENTSLAYPRGASIRMSSAIAAHNLCHFKIDLRVVTSPFTWRFESPWESPFLQVRYFLNSYVRDQRLPELALEFPDVLFVRGFPELGQQGFEASQLSAAAVNIRARRRLSPNVIDGEDQLGLALIHDFSSAGLRTRARVSVTAAP